MSPRPRIAQLAATVAAAIVAAACGASAGRVEIAVGEPEDAGRVDLGVLMRTHRPQLMREWSPGITTRMIPPPGVVETASRRARPGMSLCEARTQCEGGVCTEVLWLREADAPLRPRGAEQRELIERFGAGADGVSVALVHSSWRTLVSVWEGSSASTPGAAHAVNRLGCATYDTANRRRLTLADVVEDARDVLDRAAEKTRLAAEQLGQESPLSGYELSERSFLVQRMYGRPAITLCATATDEAHAGTAITISLPAPPPMNADGP